MSAAAVAAAAAAAAAAAVAQLPSPVAPPPPNTHSHPPAAPYYTLPRIQRIARQLLHALAFLAGCGLLHCDLKPENVLFKSYSRCDVKLIDFGSSCFVSDALSCYIQSRSYRAPEVVLGLAYGPKIDVWSLGCVLAELLTGAVLFPNESQQSILARIAALRGPFPPAMLDAGAESHKFFTADGRVYERAEEGDTVR